MELGLEMTGISSKRLIYTQNWLILSDWITKQLDNSYHIGLPNSCQILAVLASFSANCQAYFVFL